MRPGLRADLRPERANLKAKLRPGRSDFRLARVNLNPHRAYIKLGKEVCSTLRRFTIKIFGSYVEKHDVS